MVSSAVWLKKVLNPETIYSVQEIIIYVSHLHLAFFFLVHNVFSWESNTTNGSFIFLFKNFSIKHIVPILQVGLILVQLFWSIKCIKALSAYVATGQVILL